jgi:hypothetical protein
MPQPHDQQLAKTRLALESLGALDLDKLERTDLPEAYSSAAAAAVLRGFIDVARELQRSKSDLAMLSGSMLVGIRGVCEAIEGTALEVMTFEAGGAQNDMTNFMHVVEKINRQSGGWAQTLFIPLAFVKRKVLSGDVLKRAVEVPLEGFEEKSKTLISGFLGGGRKAIDDIQKEYDDLARKVSATDEKALGALEQAREAAGTRAVTRYVETFKVQADAHAKAARGWGVAVLIIAVAAIAGGVLFATWGPDLLYYREGAMRLKSAGLQIAAVKALALVVLSYLLIVSVHTHRAERHNEIVNRHRMNALATFRALSNTPDVDVPTRNAILTQATSAIFSPLPSGFLPKESHGPNTPAAAIVQTARELGGGKAS